MNLSELYSLKLREYKENGVKEQPDKLLAMLLLPEKNEYEPLMVSEGEFYKAYKEQIDEKIAAVIKDFDITDEEIINYVEEKGVSCDDFEHDKIWFVFCQGFGLMHWGIMYHSEMTPEEIYTEVFDKELKLKEDVSLTKNKKN